MTNCKNCGAPLTKGNIKVVRKKGKRPFRIHRRCPKVKTILTPSQAFIDALEPKPEVFVGKPDYGETHTWKGGTAGSPLQRPQDSTGGPIVVEGVYQYSEPTRYRFFITQDTAEKLRRAIKGGQVGITVEVIPVPDYQVEADPEALADYVEIEYTLKI